MESTFQPHVPEHGSNPMVKSDIPIIPNWKQQVAGEKDPNNREIIAFNIGVDVGKERQKEEVTKLFFTNLEISCYYSEKFFNYLTKEKKVSCDLTTIKASSPYSFQSLFLIKFSDYTNNDLRKDLYREAREFKKALQPKEIQLEIILISDNGNVDTNTIFGDGFVWRYKKESE